MPQCHTKVTDMRTYDEFLKDRTEKCVRDGRIPQDLFESNDVKKGLRDRNGKGVVAGLTRISRVEGTRKVNGEVRPVRGRLIYRGYNVEDLISSQGDELGLFEKSAYLLLFGEMPDAEQLKEFRGFLNEQIGLPKGFVRSVILRDNGFDVMNTLSRGVLNLAMYDDTLGNHDPEDNLRHSMNIIASMPAIAVFGYRAHAHYGLGEALTIRSPDPELTIAENILRMLRPDGRYTRLEALILDRVLVLHQEHGGGNNSTFTARVVSSAGSDTYSVIAAAILSLKGPKHGGASYMVGNMIEDIEKHVSDISDEGMVCDYLRRIVDGKAFDRSGLIYGVGHAVYTISDPRAEILRGSLGDLAREKGREKEFAMLNIIADKGPAIVNEKHNGGPKCANIDLYSGFAYDLLGIPRDLYTPMFAVARTVGWCAHHMEETISSNKIIRPAYLSLISDD